MNKRIISIYTNNTKASKDAYGLLKDKLESNGFEVRDDYHASVELLVTIGGDGATLQAIQKYDFPDVPIIGINTGHLGFFQEISPDQLDEFIHNYKAKKFQLQPTTAVQATVRTPQGEFVHKGFNEVVLRGGNSYTVHFDISIGDSFIERFSGDGILIATSAGSTAYNYSLGGSIVDPRLKLLQVTPIAPMNTTAYRSFTSSILLPPDLTLNVVPEEGRDSTVYILCDGIETKYEDTKHIRVEFSDTVVNLLRFETYDFWNKVKTKFL